MDEELVVVVGVSWVTAFVVAWLGDGAGVVVFRVGAVTTGAAVGGAEAPAGVVVVWQLAVTFWTAGVHGGSISIGGVPGGALTVKVSTVPLSRVAVTVH